MEFNEIVDGYVKASQRYYEKKQKLENTIAKAEEKLKRLNKNSPNWVRNLLVPLAKEIKKRLNMKAYEIYGPFGCECETTIYWANEGKDGCVKICEVETKQLQVYPRWKTDENFKTVGFELEYYDYSVNRIRKPLPHDINEIIKLIVGYLPF
jgi:hypothetical protein